MDAQNSGEGSMLTVKQVAERLQISAQSVYALVQRGDIVVHRIGCGRGSIRISEEDLASFVEATRSRSVPAAATKSYKPSTGKLKHIRISG